MAQIERVRHMEEAYDNALAAVKRMQEALDAYEASLDGIEELQDYIAGSWQRDYEDDEAGKFPADLKRGVLSQDGLYDMLAENEEVIARIRTIAEEFAGKNVMNLY
ncbi:MAG: DUF4298 domain-containing protein [Lachnospiraceae bacterium]|nr:DUF4298 domain-containing protein [Lachnospiraceae bacterium]